MALLFVVCLFVQMQTSKQTDNVPRNWGQTFLVIRTSALTLLCSLHLRFWNQTRMTREFSPVISVNCSCEKDTSFKPWFDSHLFCQHVNKWTRLLCCSPSARHATGEFLNSFFCGFLPFCCNRKSFCVNLFSQQSDLIQSFQLTVYSAIACHLF